MSTRHDLVFFLTDFGVTDVFVGVCHGVVAARAPQARVIDLTHGVPPQDVRTGALLLARAVVHLPVAVHLAVVDPGVGSARAGIAVATERGDVLVGPDNGLLWPAAQALGGVTAVHELTAQQHRASRVSATFHGRDVFAPAAADVAAGADLASLGPERDGIVGLALPSARVATGSVTAEVVLIDHFGNCQLAAAATDVDAAGLAPGDDLELSVGSDVREVRLVRTFADLGPSRLGAYVDSDGYLALTVSGGSAARTLGAAPGMVMRLERRRTSG